MPYIAKPSRCVVDPWITPILEMLRSKNECPHDRVRPTSYVLKKIGRIISKGAQLYHADTDSAAVLSQHILDAFLPDMQEGVLNYTFSRIAAGAFIPYYPCAYREWSYVYIAHTIAALERTKLELFAGGISDMVISALEGAKLEFYCRVAVPKERAARLANGDILEYIEPDVIP